MWKPIKVVEVEYYLGGVGSFGPTLLLSHLTAITKLAICGKLTRTTLRCSLLLHNSRLNLLSHFNKPIRPGITRRMSTAQGVDGLGRLKRLALLADLT